MIKYVFKDPLTIKAAAKADPQKIGEALAKIAEKSDGRLMPESIVEAAREPQHVLHKHFEWDDKIAAEAFRLDQARSIVRCIRVEGGGKEPQIAYVNIADKGGCAYRAIEDVMQSRDLQLRVLQQAERDLAAWEARYKELTDVCALISEARSKIIERRTNMESRTQG